MEESDNLRGEGDKIQFIDLRFEGWKVERKKDAPKLHILGMNDDLWDGVRGLGGETWTVCVCRWSFCVSDRL